MALTSRQADESVAEEEELFAVGPGAADGTPARSGAAGSAAAGDLGPKVTSPAANPGSSLLSDHEQADALLDASPAAANGTSAGVCTLARKLTLQHKFIQSVL